MRAVPSVPSASLTLDQSRGRGTEVQHLAATPATPSLPQRFPGRPHPNRRRRCPRVNMRAPAGSPHGEPPRGAPTGSPRARRAAATTRPAVTRERAARTPAASTRAVWSPRRPASAGLSGPAASWRRAGGTGTEPETAPASSSLGTRSQTPRWRPESGDSSGTKQTGLSLCTRSYDKV